MSSKIGNLTRGKNARARIGASENFDSLGYFLLIRKVNHANSDDEAH